MENERRLGGGQLANQEVPRIGNEKGRAPMKRMKRGKVVGPDDIHVEVWRCLGEKAVSRGLFDQTVIFGK